MTLDAATVAALTEALEDEYKARATYAAVIEAFGPVRPFTNIIRAEDRHAAALERIFADHGLPLPADRWQGAVAAPESLEAAYRAGVAGEIENRAMYDRLLATTSEPRVLRVFGNLRRASQENHLPAFQRALDRAAAPAPDRGGRRGGGGHGGGGHGGGGHGGGGHGGGGFWDFGQGGCGHGHGRGMGHGHGHGCGHGRHAHS